MLHVLYIEDQADIQTILKLSLGASKRFRVDVAGTGREGLAGAAALKPDLILLDYSLPDMDGPDILTALRADEATARIPVIFITAMTQQVDADACIARGALDVILKPFSPREVAGQILGILARHGHNIGVA
ncbi:MAG: response regulator [Rhodospirillaceae bacterium]|nr:response regulator [Rhodospirillaceae bacterium]